MTENHFQIVPHLPGFAARIANLDLSRALRDDVKEELRRALNAFGMLTIAPCTLTPEQHIDLASAFGAAAPGAFFSAQGRLP